MSEYSEKVRESFRFLDSLKDKSDSKLDPNRSFLLKKAVENVKSGFKEASKKKPIPKNYFDWILSVDNGEDDVPF